MPLVAEHAADYIALSNEPSISPRVNNPDIFTQQNFDELLAATQKNTSHFVWMICFEGAVYGAISTADARGVGIFQGGYWLMPQWRGKGIAREALALVRDFLFHNCDAKRIQAQVEPDNIASIRVLESCGYLREGLLRKFYPARARGLIDVFMYAIVRDE